VSASPALGRVSFAAFPSSLRTLELRQCGLTGTLDAALWRAIGTISHLQTLDLSMNAFDLPDVVDLSPLQAATCCSLEELSLAHQQQRKERQPVMFNFATIPTSLRRLNLAALNLRGDVVSDILAQLPMRPKVTGRRSSKKTAAAESSPESPAAAAAATDSAAAAPAVLQSTLNSLLLNSNPQLSGKLESLAQLPDGLQCLSLTDCRGVSVNEVAFDEDKLRALDRLVMY
jgi:hypothetical protein